MIRCDDGPAQPCGPKMEGAELDGKRAMPLRGLEARPGAIDKAGVVLPGFDWPLGTSLDPFVVRKARSSSE